MLVPAGHMACPDVAPAASQVTKQATRGEEACRMCLTRNPLCSLLRCAQVMRRQQ